MAGDWIPMRLDLYEDPAVMRMAESLDVREEVVVGYCHKVWSWLSRQCHGGSVTGVTVASLGRVCNLPGFPELMCDAGWLSESQDERGNPVLVVPNWDRWLSKSAKTRVKAAERQQKRRHADVANMSRSERDKSVTREEKRREENNIKNPPTPHDKRGGISFDARSVDLPFSSDAFAAAWSDWCQHRTEIRKPLKPTSVRQQIKQIEGMGEARAIAAIEHTVANGWQGLREPEQRGSPPSQQPSGRQERLAAVRDRLKEFAQEDA